MAQASVIFPASYQDKTFLIAGAAGFVPGHVAEFYLQQGARVIGLDNFITSGPQTIHYLKAKYPRFTFFETNIYLGVPDFSDIKVDYVLSLASPASPIDFSVIPLEIMRVNSEGTMHLLELAKAQGARFLEASTSEVYGDPEIHPQTENYWGNVNPIGPRSCYDESKRFAEALTMTYHRKYQVDTRIVRIFNTYGPRMRANDGRVIPNFINQALKGEGLTVYGDGEQTRSFCYVSDLVNAIHHVLFSDDPTPFNIGNPEEYSIFEVAKMIISLVGSKSPIIHRPLPEDDPKLRRPDISKLQKICAFRPQVSFESGIKATAEFFKTEWKYSSR